MSWEKWTKITEDHYFPTYSFINTWIYVSPFILIAIKGFKCEATLLCNRIIWKYLPPHPSSKMELYNPYPELCNIITNSIVYYNFIKLKFMQFFLLLFQNLSLVAVMLYTYILIELICAPFQPMKQIWDRGFTIFFWKKIG